MPFNKETASKAGKKSKRGKDKQLNELRGFYKGLLEANKGNIQVWLDSTAEKDPAKALELIIKMSSFVIPKPKTVLLEHPDEEDKVITISFLE